MAIKIPRGIAKLPLTLTEADFVKKDSVANVESEIATYQVPKRMSIAFRQGDRLAIYLATSAAAVITKGKIRIYVADANKATKFKVLETDVLALNPNDGTNYWLVSDREKMFKLPAGYSRTSDEYIIITFEGADVADDAQTRILMEGVQFLQI